jgi:peptidoglycan hydrolase CwlO-like protein
MIKIIFVAILYVLLTISFVNAQIIPSTPATHALTQPTLEQLTTEQDRDLARWQVIQYQARDLQNTIQERDAQIKKLQEANKPKTEKK